MKNIFDTVSHVVKYSNNWWDYIVEDYILPTKDISEYHYVHSKGSTFTIPLLDNDTIVMVKQYRYLNKKFSLEFPGGGLKQGITYEQNAIEELKEEAGYNTNNLNFLGEFNPYNGVTDEICKVYLAKDLIKCDSNPDSSEQFDICKLKINEINNKIIKGEIWDGMTLAAWSLFYLKKDVISNNLF